MHIVRSVDFKTDQEGEIFQGRQVEREGVRFIFHFRNDKSTK